MVVVIAIIAAVAAILLPTIGKIKREVQKVQDVSHLKKICEAWQFFADKGEVVMYIGSGSHKKRVSVFAEGLAGRGMSPEYCRLNDPYAWISSNDKFASKCISNSCVYLKNGKMDWIPSWTDCTRNNNLFKTFETDVAHSFSYCIIANLPPGVPRDTTPFAFTRGLCTDGTWHDEYGLYGDTCGCVIYCDGHIKWFNNKHPARFLKWNRSGYTTDIREAVPSQTWIMCGNEGIKTNITNKNGATMITYHSGTGGAE